MTLIPTREQEQLFPMIDALQKENKRLRDELFELKQLDVSNRRELLIAFVQWLAHEGEYGKIGSIGTVDAYLQSN